MGGTTIWHRPCATGEAKTPARDRQSGAHVSCDHWAAARKPLDAELSAYQPTERELRDYCLSVASDPSSISSKAELWTYFLARQLLKLKPEWWSPQEIADLIDKLVDNKIPIATARREVADVLGREVGAVAKTHRRFGRHKGKAGRPHKR